MQRITVIKINFNERLKIVNEILKDCPYETQKEEIMKLFELTKNEDREDVLLRLFVIDSCYSTNMNRRLFGFEELADLILKIDNKLNQNINVVDFVESNLDLLKRNIGIDKKGNPKGHAFSLLSKYIYFRTKFQFPIYDKLVFKELKEENRIELPQKPSIEYFRVLDKLKNDYNSSFDELDKYFWACGKVRKGSLSLLISDRDSYKKEYLDKLNLNIGDLTGKSDFFDKILSKKLLSEDIKFENHKLKIIQELAKSIKNETVFSV